MSCFYTVEDVMDLLMPGRQIPDLRTYCNIDFERTRDRVFRWAPSAIGVSVFRGEFRFCRGVQSHDWCLLCVIQLFPNRV